VKTWIQAFVFECNLYRYSKALDARADGYVRSEARAVLMLVAMKDPAAAAHPDADSSSAASAAAPVAVFVNGTAVNQDGRSSSLTAPNGPAQQAAMRLAIAECGGGLGQSGAGEVGLCNLNSVDP
jgi:acyl transferase domain-containing protein